MLKFTRDKEWGQRNGIPFLNNCKLPQKTFGKIERADVDGGQACAVGEYILDPGYRKGEIEFKWSDGTESIHKYRVETFEPGGSDCPYNHETFVLVDVRGVEVSINLSEFANKILGRVISCEDR